MSKKELLEKLKSEMEKDTKLPLRTSETNLVFGVGDPSADILFVGEGPGYHEDRLGEPFVGNAGKLLDQLFRLINIPRESVYITNIVHHRPPENRDPEPNEIVAYGTYLNKMIEIIDPKVVVSLGRFSMAKFLPNVKISGVHGKRFDVNWKGKDIVVVPMYHPAAALRNGEVMRQEKEDFLKLPQILEQVKNEQKEVKKSVEQMNLI
ncbi:uracil-DNA glycosylase [Patescibacteria group bacterium]